MRILSKLSALLLLVAAASAQAVVEHSLITAASTAAAANGKAAGKSVGGVFQSVGEALKKAADPGSGTSPKGGESAVVSTSVRPARPVLESKPAPESRIVEPSQITMGLEREELIARFGSPLIATIDTTTSQVVETMWYASGRFTQVQIKLVGGKVASISPPPDPKK